MNNELHTLYYLHAIVCAYYVPLEWNERRNISSFCQNVSGVNAFIWNVKQNVFLETYDMIPVIYLFKRQQIYAHYS